MEIIHGRKKLGIKERDTEQRKCMDGGANHYFNRTKRGF